MSSLVSVCIISAKSFDVTVLDTKVKNCRLLKRIRNFKLVCLVFTLNFPPDLKSGIKPWSKCNWVIVHSNIPAKKPALLVKKFQQNPSAFLVDFKVFRGTLKLFGFETQ